MIAYRITESPVLVRKNPTADSPVVNVVPVGGVIYIDGEDAGWLRTSAGYYVFRTSGIVMDTVNQVANDLNTKMRTNNFKGSMLKAEPTRTIYNPWSISIGYKPYGGGGTPSQEDAKKEQEEATETAGEAAPQPAAESDSEKRLKENLSDKYRNAAIVVPKDAKVQIQKSDGSFSDATVPEAMTKEGGDNDFFVLGTDEYGRIAVKNAEGQIYLVDGGSSDKIKLSTRLDDQGNNKYETYALEVEAKEMRRAQQELDELESYAAFALNKDVEGENAWDRLSVDQVRSLFGLPYQFLPTTDPRISRGREGFKGPLDLKGFGRKFSEKILGRSPILIMQAGEVSFLRGYSSNVKEKVAKRIMGIAGIEESEIESMMGGGGEYYSFKVANEDYYRRVNTALRALAIFLGIDKIKVEGLMSIGKSVAGKVGFDYPSTDPSTLGGFNWALQSNFSLTSYYAGAIQFYINSESQISESLSNGTRPSQLAGKINQVSDQAMEAMFVMGGLQSDVMDTPVLGSVTNGAQDAGKKTGEAIHDAASGTGLLHNIIGGIGTILAGGRMHFPELWADSQFMRSYNVTLKLDSPDTDPLSIYLNIFVPLVHILSLAMPNSAGENSYVGPFVVRAFYKSMFHVDMGIITNLDIQKGDQGCWTQGGLPTQITVQFTIKDLYTVMSQSKGEGNNTLLSNPAQLDYLANLCGVNVAPANLGRSIKLWWMLKGINRPIDLIEHQLAGIQTSIWSWIQNMFTVSRFRM